MDAPSVEPQQRLPRHLSVSDICALMFLKEIPVVFQLFPSAEVLKNYWTFHKDMVNLSYIGQQSSAMRPPSVA